jgi:hypothetical protein
MLIGTGKNKRVSEQISNLKCPNCGENGSLLMEGYQEFLIFGFPAFPTSKIVHITCTECKKYFPPSSVTNEMYSRVQYIKSKIKPTIWMFLLPILMVVLLFFVWRSSVNKSKENLPKIQKIKSGDIYTIETKDVRYNKLKVLFVEKDRIIFRESGEDPLKLKDIKDVNSFYGDTVVIPKKDLINLNDDHRIEEIDSEK